MLLPLILASLSSTYCGEKEEMDLNLFHWEGRAGIDDFGVLFRDVGYITSVKICKPLV